MQRSAERSAPATRVVAGLGAFLFFLCATACAPTLDEPSVILTPYGQSQIWGVAPFVNESGASIVDTARLADGFVEEAQGVEAIDVVPVNRVIAAMRVLDMRSITSHGDALTLMNTLGLDGLVVGSVTAYDPYRPMTLGLAVELYTRDRGGPYGDGLDSRALTRSTSGHVAPGELGPSGPAAHAAGVFDAANHGTLAALEEYARGRAEPDSAYGEEIYLVSMDVYVRFASHRLLRDLLEQERAVGEPMVAQEE